MVDQPEAATATHACGLRMRIPDSLFCSHSAFATDPLVSPSGLYSSCPTAGALALPHAQCGDSLPTFLHPQEKPLLPLCARLVQMGISLCVWRALCLSVHPELLDCTIESGGDLIPAAFALRPILQKKHNDIAITQIHSKLLPNTLL
jgi:hypothetical protein